MSMGCRPRRARSEEGEVRGARDRRRRRRAKAKTQVPVHCTVNFGREREGSWTYWTYWVVEDV